MESRSKFACLNIDDDSDEEFTKVANKANMKKGAGAGQGGPKVKNGGKLVVHAIEKRPKAKKANKEKIVDPSTGLVVQGVDENYLNEQKFKEASACKDLKQALRESARTASNQTPSPTHTKSPSPVAEETKEVQSSTLVDKIVASIEEEWQRQSGKANNGQKDGDPVMIALYRSKLTELLEEMIKAKEKLQSAQSEVDRYRTKYRKLVELFRDTEVTEKAKLVMDLEKSRTSGAELASQLVVTQRELEQCKSKLRALGALK
ncbi:unnamed protein product [Nippostrongylus brasiliensis]|uniref:G kinase-anchoring protein 1 n=1 Tax=Nippostrongylus brasiliensis TaxID=27835 RepID=A0A0N4XXW5_NIPBR|nr:hypothetical protein Q1695_008793 [Nippostrongylus brasiliensis]VDL71463.1 unnamed protein product [Nippostrongylus brasiliensis]